MRFLLVLPLALLLLAGCAKSDREMMNGVWSIQEMKANGELVYAAEKGSQDKIVDRIVSEQMASLPPEAQGQAQMMKDMMYKQLAVVSKTTLEVKEDGKFVATRYDGDTPIETKGTLTIDEKKKEFSMKGEKEEKFKYEIKDGELKLTSNENGKLELTFKPKK